MKRILTALVLICLTCASQGADVPIVPSAAFAPDANTYFVGTSSTQVTSSTKAGVQPYRVRNLSGSVQYFTWGTASAVTSVGAPTQGVPSANTIGMLGSSVETFTLPSNAWVIASSSTGFEFTPGEGT